MKIAIVAHTDGGGAGKSAYRLFDGLRTAGASVKMLVLQKTTLDPDVRVLPVLLRDGDSCYDHTIPESQHEAMRMFQGWKNRWNSEYPNWASGYEMFSDHRSRIRLDLVKEIQEADIINLHWVAGILDVSSVLGRLAHKKIFWTLHDMNAFTGGCHYSNGCLRFQKGCGSCPQLASTNQKDASSAVHTIKRAGYEGVPFQVITPSRWLQKSAQSSSLFKDRTVHHIPYGIPLQTFKPRDSGKLRQQLGIAPETRVLLFGAVELNERKGKIPAVEFIKAFKPAENEEVAFVSFGTIPDDLKSPYGIPSYSLGQIHDEQKIAEIYSMADVFILPSIEDNLPNVVLESLACGTPVVGFRTGGVPDMLTHQKDGYVCNGFAGNTLVEGVRWVLDQPKAEIQRAAFEKGHRYRPEIQAEAYLELFGQSLGRHSAPGRPSRPRLSSDRLHEFVYPKRKHLEHFERFGPYATIDPFSRDLKAYQDLLTYTHIIDNLPPGARILEIGGGNSRVLQALAEHYECWNLDKAEGIGNGPTQIISHPKVQHVYDYIGVNSKDLPEEYFDLVFSISTLEHLETTRDSAKRMLDDVDRILRPGGLSFHTLDLTIKHDDSGTDVTEFMQEFEDYIHRQKGLVAPLHDLHLQGDLYAMPEALYQSLWYPVTGIPYQEFGKPTSALFYWKKQPWKTPYRPEVVVPKTKPLQIALTTASYNSAETLEETIDSILSQGYSNLHYTIMDGGSTDGTLDVIKKYEPYLHSWHSEKDEGQYFAIRKGLNTASGEIMGWVNSDDALHPESLAKLDAFFREYPFARWVTGQPSTLNAQGAMDGVDNYPPVLHRSDLLNPQNALSFRFIQQESTFWKRSLWDQVGGLDCDYRYAADFDLWMRFSRHSALHFLRELLGSFRNREEQVSVLHREKYLDEASTCIAREHAQIRKGMVSSLDRPAVHPVLTPAQIQTAIISAQESAKQNKSLRLSLPKVSAIVSAYQVGEGLSDKLLDLTSQTLFHKDELEIIVVDSASPLDERSPVHAFQSRYGSDRIRYLRTRARESVYAAWNRGLTLARGIYACNANADDRLRPDALERLSDYLDDHPLAILVHADQIRWEKEQEDPWLGPRNWNWPPFKRTSLLHSTHVGSQPMWRTQLHYKQGFFNPGFRIRGDHEYFLRISGDGEFGYLNEALGLMNFNPDSLSQDHKLSAREHSVILQWLLGRQGLSVFFDENLPMDVRRQQILINELVLQSIAEWQEEPAKLFNPAMLFELLQIGYGYDRRADYLVRNALRIARRFQLPPQKINSLIDSAGSQALADWFTKASGSPFESAVNRAAKAQPGRKKKTDAQAPKVSIIIPIYGKWSYTENCLSALNSSAIKTTFEVIVVDDASQDHSWLYLQQKKDSYGFPVKLVRHKQNKGFACACNSGILKAEGDHILLLNNDVEVTDGWLDHMLAELDKEAKTGVVGAVLTYGGGRHIQHCGVSLGISGGYWVPMHVDRGYPMAMWKKPYRRSLDAVTGACMLIRGETLRQVGLLDEGFINGYEDVDLCFRARQRGWNVAMCYQAIMQHAESVSGNRIQHDENNYQLFLKKWKKSAEPSLNEVQSDAELKRNQAWRSLMQTPDDPEVPKTISKLYSPSAPIQKWLRSYEGSR